MESVQDNRGTAGAAMRIYLSLGDRSMLLLNAVVASISAFVYAFAMWRLRLPSGFHDAQIMRTAFVAPGGIAFAVAGIGYCLRDVRAVTEIARTPKPFLLSSAFVLVMLMVSRFAMGPAVSNSGLEDQSAWIVLPALASLLFMLHSTVILYLLHGRGRS